MPRLIVPSSGGGTKLIRMFRGAGVGLGDGDSCAAKLPSNIVTNSADPIFFVIPSEVEDPVSFRAAL
jgi:hypothetical protein